MTEVKYDMGNGYEMSVEYDEKGIAKITRECFEMLIEKQIAKKYVYKPHIISSYRCPDCDSFISISSAYCPVCGQHILWGEGGEE